MKMVNVTALLVATRATRIGIVHLDPEGIDPRARKSVLPVDVAEKLADDGLLKIGSTVSDQDARPGARLSESIVGDAIQERVEESAADPDDDTLINGGDTRDTTAFPDNPKAAPLRTAAVADAEKVEGDADAPALDEADADSSAGKTAKKTGGAAAATT